MPGLPPDEAQARIAYYQSRRKLGGYLNDPLYFYTGAPTVPQSFTGNLIAVGDGNGPGAKIINGIGPAVPDALPCDEPVITSLTYDAAPPDFLALNVEYNILPGDIWIVFNTTTGQVLYPTGFITNPSGVQLIWDMTSPPADGGSWTFKIIRADNIDCFAIRSGVYVTSGAVCPLDAEAWTFLGGAPFPPVVFGFGPPISTQIVGTGFLSCPIGVSVDLVFGFAPPTQIVSSLVVVNDNLITFDVARDGIGGFAEYEATVFCTDDPGCSDLADNTLTYGVA